MTGGGHFRHPGRRWLPCETGYFADLGVGDMPGREDTPKIATPEAVAGRLLPIAKLQAMMLARTCATRAQARAATSLIKPQRGVPEHNPAQLR